MKTRLKVVAVPEPTTLVDQLGRVKAKIAALELEEGSLRQLLIDSGVDEAEGRLFRATVVTTGYTKVDYKGLLEELKPSARMLAKYTEVNDRTTVKVVSR